MEDGGVCGGQRGRCGFRTVTHEVLQAMKSFKVTRAIVRGVIVRICSGARNLTQKGLGQDGRAGRWMQAGFKVLIKSGEAHFWL